METALSSNAITATKLVQSPETTIFALNDRVPSPKEMDVLKGFMMNLEVEPDTLEKAGKALMQQIRVYAHQLCPMEDNDLNRSAAVKEKYKDYTSQPVSKHSQEIIIELLEMFKLAVLNLKDKGDRNSNSCSDACSRLRSYFQMWVAVPLAVLHKANNTVGVSKILDISTKLLLTK